MLQVCTARPGAYEAEFRVLIYYINAIYTELSEMLVRSPVSYGYSSYGGIMADGIIMYN